jgi:tetratricopeptide (TPR) repeat protein
MNLANLYYRKFSYYGQKSDVYKAIETAKSALELPGAQEKGGPRAWVNRVNRVSLYAFLAKCYIEQILEPCEQRSDSENSVLLSDAEQAVHKIEQILGSGEDLQVIKWRGMLELAKGNRDIAIKKLYATYEQFKASAKPDAHLSYTLAKIFRNTSEVGIVLEFLVSALKGNIIQAKPEAHLDYADTLLKLEAWTVVISNIDAYEELFGVNDRSRMLRIKAYIGARQFDEADEELAELEPDDPNTIKLNLEMAQARMNQIKRAISQEQMEESLNVIYEQPNVSEKEEANEPKASVKLMMKELNDYRQLAAELVQKLLPIEPNYVQQEIVTILCNDYVEQGQISEARDLMDKYLQHFPDSTTALVFKQMLSEPEPGKVSQERRKEIEERVFSDIADPARRAINLGLFYRINDETEKAATEFKKVLEIKPQPQSAAMKLAFEQEEETNLQFLAADYLFDIAAKKKDWELAEQIVETAESDNLDECQGQLFAARLDMAKGDFKNALAKLDECLKQRPIFSRVYMMRSSVNAELGDERASIEDIRKAAFMNPLNGTIAQLLAVTLYNRNQKLGDSTSPEQLSEAKAALDRAMLLNPSDLQLLSFYADYISETQPLRALLILQSVQKNAPSVRIAVRLGQLSTKLAVEERDAKRKQSLFAAAAGFFEQAKKMDPQDKGMLFAYAEYYRARGMEAEAENILQGSNEQMLILSHYFQGGQFEKAKKFLEKSYESNPKDIQVVKGLLYVAEKTNDEEAAKKYSDELLSLQDSVENRLLQIQIFLKIGLIEESERKLQSFKESYPDESRSMLLEAWLVMRQGQLEKAGELVNKVLQSDQNSAAAWQLRGQINLLLANYEQAIADLQKSKALSDDPNTRINLARAYLRSGMEEEAITELKNIIDSPAVSKEARMLLEQIYMRLGRKEALRAFYDDTLEKFPDDVSWYNSAGASAIADNDFDRAEQLYKEAYLRKQQSHLEQGADGENIDNEYATAFDGYLQALVLGAGASGANKSIRNPEKLNKVLEESNKHIADSLAPIAFYRMAEAKMKLGEEKVAIEYCRKAVDEAKTNETLASEILLKMFLLLGPEEVSKYCEQMLSTNPDSLAANWAMYNLANINADYKTAIDYINKCIKIAGPETPRGVNYAIKKVETLTLAFEKTSDNNYLKQGITDYESLLAKMPNNINVLNNFAYMLVENNERLSDALRYAKQAVDARPNNPSFLDTYAYVLYKNGNLSQAAETVAAALQQYEQSGILAPPDVYEHLGMIKENLGAKEQALDAYKQALEVGADKLSEKVRERIQKAIERISQ